MTRYEFYKWDKSREWPPKHATRLRKAVITAIRQGRLSRDMHAKMRDRAFSEQDMIATVTSPKSYAMRFLHRDGVNRVGFWNPRTEWLVIWLPGYGKRDKGMIVSCFWHPNGIEYMRNYSGVYREIFSPGDE